MKPLLPLAARAARAALATAALSAALPWALPAAGEERPPNLLFIITDDQAPDELKAYDPGSPLDTPNLDRIAREGMVLDAAYHMGAFVSGVCTPSRYMVKSGRTLWHLPIAPEAETRCPPGVEEESLAAVFNRAGYATMRTGKPGNSWEAGKAQFAVRRDSAGRSGTEVEGTAWHGRQVLLLFTSDHGIAIGRHGLQGKQNLYEHSWRVPLLAMGPGIAPGSRAPGMVYLLDVLATLCDLAAIPAPETNEGLSFKPVLKGEAATVRDVVYGVHGGGTKPGVRSVRQGDWKLIKYDGDGGATRETQLFNLAENPFEFLDEHRDPAVVALTGVEPAAHQTNLAADPRHAGKLAEMEALLLEEMRRHHDPWRLWDQPDDGLPALPDPATLPRRR